MSADQTLMVVHAHPDDEVPTTGGTLAKYAARGVRTVLITCTNGDQGDGADGAKPGDPAHDPSAVAAQRVRELQASAAHLNISHLELLDYPDSGVGGWPRNQDPANFSNQPLASVASRIAELIRQYRPDVVVTYAQNGMSSHPDHVRTHEATMAALEQVAADAIDPTVYFTALARSRLQALHDAATGQDQWLPPIEIGTDDALITTYVDISSHIDAKVEALRAHNSQADATALMRLLGNRNGPGLTRESFIRVRERAACIYVETDLFPVEKKVQRQQ
ncbi:PIG-L family deacetylase [Streptomyces misionensis]|uniref:PIG-L deacetylase family protein n=1 Tax=Streptomyces misionensis TaxID=67331 RepID=UPI0033CDF614